MAKASTAAAKTAKPVARKSAAAKTSVVAAPVATKAVAAKKPVDKPAKKPAKQAVKAKPEVESKEKVRKPKLVRDSFTMPEAEYAVLGDVKKACLKAGIDVKKSELLRVGVALIRQLDSARLKEILTALPTLKAGRPKKAK
jgi:hypothetical protein